MDHVWSAVVAHWFTAVRHGIPVDCWALWDGGEHLAVGQAKADVTLGNGHITELRVMVNFTEPNPFEPHRFKLADFVVIHAAGSQTTLELINATIADGLAALTVTFAISFGLLIPKLAIDWLSERSAQHHESARPAPDNG